MTSAHTVEVRFFGSTKDFEAALAKMGIATDVAAKDMGKKFDAGASKVGGTFSKLGQKLEGWGIPFTGSLSKIDEALQGTEAKGKAWSGVMAEAGKAASVGIIGAAGVIGVESFKLGTQWQSAMASMATHAGIGIAAADKIGAAFLSTAGKSEFSAEEMAAAYAPVAGEFTNLTGHALNAKQALDVMSAASDLATASGEPLVVTTKAIADVMLPFHMNVSQAGGAANTLWNTQRLLGVSTSDLTNVYQRLTPFVAGSGMSFGQLSGMMVELSHSLGGGRQAARVAGRAIQSLIDPSSSANKALDGLGISLFNAQGKFIGMPKAIGELKSALATLPGASAGVAAEQKVLALTQQAATLKSMTQTAAVKAQEKAITAQLPALKLQAGALTQSSVMQKLFGSNANAMLAVIAGGPAEFNKYTAAVQKHGQVESAAALQSKTWHVQLQTLKATAEDLGTKLGAVLVPAVEKVAGDIAKTVSWFERHKAVATALATVIGGVLVSAMATFAITTGQKALRSVQELGQGVMKLGTLLMEKIVGTSGAVTAAFEEEGVAAEESGAASEGAFGPIGLAIGLVVIAATELVTHWKTVSHWLSSIWGGIKSVAITVWHGISGFFKQWWPLVLGIMTGGVLLIPALLIKYWHTVYTDAETAWNDVIGFFEAIPGKLIAALSSLGHLLVGWLGDAWHLLVDAVNLEISGLETIFIGVPIKVIGWLASLGSDLVTWIGEAWTGLTGALSSAVTGMGTYVKGIPGTILGWFGNAGQMLYQWGSDLITGLVNGIKSVAGDIGGAIKSAFDSLPGVSLLRKVPGLSWLAEGGLITKPTLAVVGEAGPELVLPLSKVAPMLSQPQRLPTSFAAVANITGQSIMPASASNTGPYGTAGPAGTGGGVNLTVNHGPITITGLPEQIAGQVQAQLDNFATDLTRQVQQAVTV